MPLNVDVVKHRCCGVKHTITSTDVGLTVDNFRTSEITKFSTQSLKLDVDCDDFKMFIRQLVVS